MIARPCERESQEKFSTMKVHEYQGRQLLADAGIPVPPGEMVESVDAAVSAARTLFNGGAALAVIKAQVHAGGRGKAGFVRLVKSVDEALNTPANELINAERRPATTMPRTPAGKT